MRIGNSTIHFNTSINTRQFKTRNIADVPYWSLYARKGDCIGEGWKSVRNLTYNEIVEYLTNYEGHRVLEAYPRRTKVTRHTHVIKHESDYFVIIDKKTAEILLMYNTRNKETVILSPDYKSDTYLLSLLYKDKARKVHTSAAVHAIVHELTVKEANNEHNSNWKKESGN